MRYKIVPLILISIILSGCQSFNFVDSLKKINFSLVDVSRIEFCGVDFKGKEKLKDFSAMEILTFTSNIASGKFPGKIDFLVKADNEADLPDAFSLTEVSINSFPYKLFLYDKEIVSGNIKDPVRFPGAGEELTFEIEAGFDLFNSLNDVGYEKLINTVIALKDGDFGAISAKVTAKPVLGLPWGNYEFPEELKLENKID